MRGVIIRWCIGALSLILTAAILPGIEVGNLLYALVAAALLGILNAVLRPLLLIFTLPINILSLGLFTLVINGFILYVVAYVIKGVKISGFGWAILGALIIGLISWALNSLVSDRGKMEVIDLKRQKNGRWHL